jgi:hypothetical protein
MPQLNKIIPIKSRLRQPAGLDLILTSSILPHPLFVLKNRDLLPVNKPFVQYCSGTATGSPAAVWNDGFLLLLKMIRMRAEGVVRRIKLAEWFDDPVSIQ